MLHHRNQQLHARENRIPRSSPIETLPNLPRKGLVFRFSLLIPSPHPAIPHSPYDRSRFSAHPRSQKLLRPQRNGHSVVPSGQVHARKKIRKKSSPLVSRFNLSIPSALRFFFLFFNQSKFSDFVPFCCLCKITFTCAPAESAALQRLQKSFTRHLDPGKLILTDRLFPPRSLKNRVAIKYKRYKLF